MAVSKLYENTAQYLHPKQITGLLEVYEYQMHSPSVLPFFIQYLMDAKYQISS
jgi:hypothetical protein